MFNTVGALKAAPTPATGATVAPVTVTDSTETVVQTVILDCGHQFQYRIGRMLAESGFARSGVAWRCARCDPFGDTKLPVVTVHNAPANVTT